MNEELAPETFLDLTLTQHPRDEDPEPQEVRVRFEVKPLQVWYYHIFPNFCTMVILLQVDLTSNDELETVYEGCYKTKNNSIFAWSSVLGIRHYRWLRGLICQLPLNSKADYLIHTTRCILDFLQLQAVTEA